MNVNFKNIKNQPSFKIFFVEENKKNLKNLSFSPDININQYVLEGISKRKFNGKFKEICHFEALHTKKNINFILVGIGKKNEFKDFHCQYIGGLLFSFFESLKYKQISLFVNIPKGFRISYDNIILDLALGLKLKSYNFKKYKSNSLTNSEEITLNLIDFFVSNPSKLKKLYIDYNAIAEGIFFSRELLYEPPNVLNPINLASRAKGLSKLNIKVNVLDEKKMRQLGMGALLGVGMGSSNPSRLVTLEWNGNPSSKKASLGLVGKGVTFDTGGISIKPSEGMEEMKMDMGGSALVLGVMKTLALRKAKTNVVGVIGLVENMVSSKAQRPSDIVKSMSGKTIEVLNTDAEGRLVLADALWYCQEKFKVKTMINFATLTGAIIVALGDVYAGLFSNSDDLSYKLIKSGRNTDEKVWQLPLGNEYDELLDCDIADVKNITGTKGAGSITAAQFLKRFVNDEVNWAHLDIAGVAWINKDLPLSKKGGTGFGIRLINDYISNNFERK